MATKKTKAKRRPRNILEWHKSVGLAAVPIGRATPRPSKKAARKPRKFDLYRELKPITESLEKLRHKEWLCTRGEDTQQFNSTQAAKLDCALAILALIDKAEDEFAF